MRGYHSDLYDCDYDYDYDDRSDDYDEPCLEDYMDKPWIWPGFGMERGFDRRRCMTDLELAVYFYNNNHLNLSDQKLYDIGCAVDQYDEELLALFDERTVIMCKMKPGRKSARHMQAYNEINDKIWARLQLFAEERDGWKRAMLYKISLASGMDEDHPVYGGKITALYQELQEALLNPDRVDKVGLQMTIQMIDPVVVGEINDLGEFIISKMFDKVPERPKKFVPDPDAW